MQCVHDGIYFFFFWKTSRNDVHRKTQSVYSPVAHTPVTKSCANPGFKRSTWKANKDSDTQDVHNELHPFSRAVDPLTLWNAALTDSTALRSPFANCSAQQAKNCVKRSHVPSCSNQQQSGTPTSEQMGSIIICMASEAATKRSSIVMISAVASDSGHFKTSDRLLALLFFQRRWRAELVCWRLHRQRTAKACRTFTPTSCNMTFQTDNWMRAAVATNAVNNTAAGGAQTEAADPPGDAPS